MLDKNDWRLTNQEEYLKNKTLIKQQYTPYSKEWEHEHCVFCWDKFSLSENDLHNGYCTLDKSIWICSECFNDFKELFGFQLSE